MLRKNSGIVESLINAGQFFIVGKDYVELCIFLTKNNEAIIAIKLIAVMLWPMNKSGWYEYQF